MLSFVDVWSCVVLLVFPYIVYCCVALCHVVSLLSSFYAKQTRVEHTITAATSQRSNFCDATPTMGELFVMEHWRPAPTSYPHPTHILPTSYRHPTHILPTSYPHPTDILPTSYPHPTLIQPTYSLKSLKWTKTTTTRISTSSTTISIITEKRRDRPGQVGFPATV